MKHALISGEIIKRAIEVHRVLGPVLMESAYEECLSYELRSAGIAFDRQYPAPLVYKDIRLEQGYRMDLLVDNTVIVEIKSVERLNPVHEAQVLTYMKFSGKEVGLLMNFNVLRLKDGLKRFVR